MGRRKLKVEKIVESRNRNACFTKRKNGLIKKAMELAIMCGAEVSLIVMYPDGKSTQGNMFRFETREMNDILQMWNATPGKKETCTTKDYAKFAAQASKEKEGKRKSLRDDDDSSSPYVEPLDFSQEEDNEQLKKPKIKECEQSKSSLVKNTFFSHQPQPIIKQENASVYVAPPPLPVAKEVLASHEKSLQQPPQPTWSPSLQESADFFRVPSMEKLDEYASYAQSLTQSQSFSSLQTNELLDWSPQQDPLESAYPQGFLNYGQPVALGDD